MNKKIILAISGFCLILTVFSGFVIFKKNRQNLPIGIAEIKEISLEAKSKNEIKCQDNWLQYQNDILGLGFCYPIEWGDVIIEPIENLTSLDGVVDEYSKDEHNSFNNSLYLKFKNLNDKAYETRNNLELHFFNERYGGEYYPNARAYDKGYIDNIADLKNNKNICEYKTNFTELWGEQGRITELWSECGGGIKNRILNHEEYFDKNIYSFKMESLAYTNLENGFFDNLLVQKRYLDIVQVEKKINNFEQIFEAKNYPSQVDNSKVISIEEYREQKEEFAKFVKSIYSYAPILKKESEFHLEENEDDKITAIRKYYWLLENQKLDEAYTMHLKNNSSKDEFQSMYGRVFKSEARDFKKLKDGTYKFFVDYQDHNSEKELYRIEMRVADDLKIETVSAEKIVSEMVKFGDNYLAYAKERDGKSFVVLERYGAELTIDEGVANYNEDHSNIGEVKFFRDIKFSPNGNYLIYKMFGWEWMVAYVYDIQNDKKVFEFSSPNKFDFSQDEKYLFLCASDGMTEGASGSVYRTPDFKKQFDLLGEKKFEVAMDVKCDYDQVENKIIFVYGGDCQNVDDQNKNCQKQEVIYSLDKNQLEGKSSLNN